MPSAFSRIHRVRVGVPAARSGRTVSRFGVSTVVVAVLGAAIATGAVAGVLTMLESSTPTIPPEKQAILHAERTRADAARSAAKPKPPEPVRSSPKPIPARVGGLIRGIKQGPFRPTEFQNNDIWQGAVGGRWDQVYAGSDVATGTAVGELRLYGMPIDPNAGPNVYDSLGTFTPPSAEETLSIERADGVVLEIVGSSGARYEFDVATKAWKTE